MAATAELIVVYAQGQITSSAQAGPAPTSAFVSTAALAGELGVNLTPIFEDIGLESFAEDAGDDQARRYASALVEPEAAFSLSVELRNRPEIETAYVRQLPENPIAPYDERDQIWGALAAESLAGAGIPDFRLAQGYLGAAPGGVAATAAWQKPCGRGDDVRIIDIEGGWCLDHLDLQPNDGLLGGAALPGPLWRNHGTAVLGVLGGKDGAIGITGIAPGARIGAVSHGGLGAARAIEEAGKMLSPGDIMVLEMHDAGPRFGFTRREDQRGYIAMEWWPDIFIAIQRAVARGVIVVEAAGNGAESLDDILYATPHPDFPTSWRNPFSLGHDSGSILVGAGAPPGGAFGPDRSRLDFSNFGSRVDCQGWGRSVVTTGYGDLFGEEVEEQMFTARFSGTSSATPIVAGAIACLVGAAKNAGHSLTPALVRNLLRATGSPQQDGVSGPASQRIGRRPDLTQLLEQVGV